VSVSGLGAMSGAAGIATADEAEPSRGTHPFYSTVTRGTGNRSCELRTWTYLVNDDPFRNQIGMMLTGPAGATVTTYAAAVMMPLLFLWGLVDRLLRKPSKRRRDPFGT
jgi:hypothetical protein